MCPPHRKQMANPRCAVDSQKSLGFQIDARISYEAYEESDRKGKGGRV